MFRFSRDVNLGRLCLQCNNVARQVEGKCCLYCWHLKAGFHMVAAIVIAAILVDHQQKNSNKFYCSCHPTWPPRSLSFQSLGNSCKPVEGTLRLPVSTWSLPDRDRSDHMHENQPPNEISYLWRRNCSHHKSFSKFEEMRLFITILFVCLFVCLFWSLKKPLACRRTDRYGRTNQNLELGLFSKFSKVYGACYYVILTCS